MPNRTHNMEAESLTAAWENAQTTPAAGSSITRVAHHGWAGSLLISNGIVEAIVVPQIGRVMQFRLVGDVVGTFWENRALDGRQHPTPLGEWLNFGGDKCWPSPQSSWALQQGRPWPPPHAFDGSAMQASLVGEALVLTSVVDAAWGIQVVRHIRVEANQPVLHIRTEYHKVHGPPVRTGIWTVTQFQDPEQVFIPLHPSSKFKDGYVNLLDTAPAGLTIHDPGIEISTRGRELSLARHRKEYTKIGADGASLAWVGRTCAVHIDNEPTPGDYPDGGCMTEIYTNPDPLNYVELETLGPLIIMNPGDCIQQSLRYRIFPAHKAE